MDNTETAAAEAAPQTQAQEAAPAAATETNKAQEPQKSDYEQAREDFFKRAEASRAKESQKSQESGENQPESGEKPPEGEKPAPTPKSQQKEEKPPENKEPKIRANERIRQLVERDKANKAEIERLKAELGKYQTSEGEELSVKDQVRREQLVSEYNAKIRENEASLAEHGETLKKYAVTLGGNADKFISDYRYYAPEFNRRCPVLIQEIISQGGEQWPLIINTLMDALSDGTEKMERLEKMPPPAVRNEVARAVKAMNAYLDNKDYYDARIKEAEAARYALPKAAPPAQAQQPAPQAAKQPPSIVPRQSKTEPEAKDAAGSYFEYLMHRKLNSL